MNQFTTDLSDIAEPAHSLTEVEKEQLFTAFKELKHKVETQGYEMTLEDQKIVIDWLRADRETKFILSQKPVKEKVPKPPRVKKPKKLTQKALGVILLKEMKGEELTEEEARNKHFTLTGETL